MNPFGIDISSDDILETLDFFDGWEDRYRYIIDLGKQLPAMAEEKRTDDALIKGCQSQVWIHHQQQGEQFLFDVDSDALIVKGLLAVVLAAYNGKTAAQIAEFDIEQYFDRLDLLNHLSPTRGNGLRSMVERIRSEAA